MGAQAVFRIVATFAWVIFATPAISADTPVKSRTTASDKEIERGRYIVAISGCHDCHTPGYLVNGGKVPQKDWLTGSAMGWRGTWGTTYSANLRLYFQEMTEDQWVQLAREIRRRPPMPYYSLNAMSQSDMRSMYKFIRSLGPAGKPAPQFVPPDKTPPQPYVQFPDQLN
jgi:mono/diheme cytochrome c family protein